MIYWCVLNILYFQHAINIRGTLMKYFYVFNSKCWEYGMFSSFTSLLGLAIFHGLTGICSYWPPAGTAWHCDSTLSSTMTQSAPILWAVFMRFQQLNKLSSSNPYGLMYGVFSNIITCVAGFCSIYNSIFKWVGSFNPVDESLRQK